MQDGGADLHSPRTSPAAKPYISLQPSAGALKRFLGHQPEAGHQPQVDADERERALETLESSALFLEATAGKPWTAVSETPNMTDGQKVGIGLIVDLESPVDSDGPWLAVYCKGTVSQEFRFAYRGVSRLGAGFDGGGHLTGLMPLPSESLTFDEDTATTPPPTCPEGFEDEEN